ncbi:MAG: EAL domain-containing protein [Caulobacteraceae bacterium]|nr:EAL domain-containing protein [Caulobacteraceae bacterium]
MTADPFRFLGLAFATADLLFEIGGAGQITFAAGAGRHIAGNADAQLTGQPWLGLFVETDRGLAEALVAGIEDGERRGPVDVRLAAGSDGVARQAALSVFRLPQLAPRISCALTLTHRQSMPGHADGGLHERGEFEAMVGGLIERAREDGLQLELGLIELAGLDQQRKALAPKEVKALDLKVAGALRAESYGDAAADLGDQRFAVLRRKDDAPDAVARRLRRVLGAAIEPTAHAVALDAIATPSRMMRALRFSLDTYISEGEPPKASSLSEMLGHSVQRTIAEAGAFGALVQAKRFKLVYQPVVSLSDGTTHHHEVLVRFDGDRSPFGMIRMAEELDIIGHLDLAIAEEAAARIRNDRTDRLRLAINVSGRTIISPNFMQAITNLSKDGRLKDRLMLELTETAAIDDLQLAQSHIIALQALGLKVCLDDFGSGASSFAYLQQLSVDVVKIDGSYVRELASSGRDDAMIRHLVNLCRELGVSTVAEMVETQAIEDVLRRAGVDFAQGWLYGQAATEPAYPTARPTPVASRRRGAVEQWG